MALIGGRSDLKGFTNTKRTATIAVTAINTASKILNRFILPLVQVQIPDFGNLHSHVHVLIFCRDYIKGIYEV